MRSSRIGKLAAALTLSLGVAACGASTTSPKLQIPPSSPSKPAGSVTASKPMDKESAKPADKPADAVKGADPAKITKANYAKIMTGMSEKEVRELLGAPSSVQPSGDGMGQVCTWQAGKKVITATFRDDRLTSLSEANISDDK